MKAHFASCCRTLLALRNFLITLPTGSPIGRASASTARIPTLRGDEYIKWLKARGRNPHDKLIIASDALDVDEILGLHAYFGGALAAMGSLATISAVPPIFSTAKNGPPAVAFASAPAGELC